MALNVQLHRNTLKKKLTWRVCPPFSLSFDLIHSRLINKGHQGSILPILNNFINHSNWMESTKSPKPLLCPVAMERNPIPSGCSEYKDYHRVVIRTDHVVLNMHPWTLTYYGKSNNSHVSVAWMKFCWLSAWNTWGGNFFIHPHSHSLRAYRFTLFGWNELRVTFSQPW